MPEPDRSGLVRRPARTIRTAFPIIRWLPRYGWRRDLPADLLAGIAVAALLVPESMGYAGVAGVPAEVGLYAALGAVVAYALTGRTSILVVGPASAVAALSASIVGDFRGDLDPVQLTAGLAIACGVLLVVAGALHLGWIVNFISRPVLQAFVAGLSISIIIGQLDSLFGVEIEGESAVARLVATVRSVADWEWPSVALGLGALAALLLIERFARPVPAAVVVVVLGIVLVTVLDLGDHGVAVVGEIPQGLPDVGVPDLGATRWLELLAGGLALLLVGFSEGYASAASVSASTGETVDADQELVGAGAANLASGLVGGLAVSGSLSKSAAAQEAGARSQLANLTAGAVVLATLLFLGPVFEELPEPVLAAVVIAAVMASADPRRVLALRHVNPFDFAAASATFVLTLVWDTLPAMVVGVLLSLAFVVRRASFPDVVELRRDRHGEFHALAPAPETDADGDERVAVLRFEAPLIYANADRLLQAARTMVGERTGLVRFVFDGEMVSDLDSTGAEALATLDEDLTERGIELHLARVHDRARAQMERSGLARRFATRMHSGIREASALP